MFSPSFKDFVKLSRQGNIIPVYQTINADLDTPVSAFLKIRKTRYSFLLESVEGQEKIARYSFLGSNPSLVFRSKAKSIKIIYPQRNKTVSFTTQSSPLDEIKKIMKDFKAVHIKGLPRFYGGLVGFIGYDMVRFFEELSDKNPDDLKIPDAVLILTDTVLIFDHVNHTIKILNNVILPKKGASVKYLKKTYNDAIKKISLIYADMRRSLKDDKISSGRDGKPALILKSNYKKKDYESIIKKGKSFINRGDIIQVVLSQRFHTKIKRSPFEIYRNLRSLNPSPYMFYLDLAELALVGASPEMLVRCEDGIVRTRPIAGTRPRGATEEEDRKLEIELLNDTKEKAEHVMLVDLGRNDLGRVCLNGKVEVNEFMNVEKYSHVMHIVSEVKGVLDRRFDIYDVLRACFPAGTVSGSPKVRAMEIIDELENLRRGTYAGCVGYFSFSHNMDTCITIRTIVVKHNTAYIQAGAGIVSDSIPDKEYFESVNKAKALVEAITN